MSIQVAVRVRPFNQREQELNTKTCIEMDGPKTTLLCLEDPKKNKDFTFDYSFWSHDEFETNEQGLYVPTSTKYADQQSVYNQVGVQILDNAWLGYHCCLFAYGQTGAGKSYSMVGYKPNIGIVPIACKEIFQRIESNNDETIEYEVTCSMLEIYNEKVQDLLIPVSKRPQGGLKIREHKSIGFYVEGLTKHPVQNYEQIENKMDDGNKNRTIASTQMNASSSRAHTIITVELRQKITTDLKKVEKFSVINLVDLAGSEKVGKTGATGDRLKEAGQINKSLHMLGMVISKLAENEINKKQQQVPYRDSCLTKILCNALGGNSKTLMICAISPSTDNYEETLSTLRYADQAKKIKNKAVINESATDKIIRELSEENQRLKILIEKFQSLGIDINDPSSLAMFGSQFKEIQQYQEDIEENQHLIQDMEKQHVQQIEEQKERSYEVQIDESRPYLENLNEDPILNFKIKYALLQQQIMVGKKTNTNQPDIMLSGLGIQIIHAIINNEDDSIFLSPYDDKSASFLYVNGDPVVSKIELFNSDRVIFGNNAFIFRSPKQSENSQVINNIDYEFAMEEITQKENIKKTEKEQKLEKEQSEQMQQKIREIEENYKREKEEKEQEIQRVKDQFLKKQQEFEDRIKTENEKKQAEQQLEELKRQQQLKLDEIKAEQQKQEQEREKEKKKIQDEETLKKHKIKEKHYLENKLSKYLPKILEVNLIAKELKRNVNLQAKLTYYYQTDTNFNSDDKAKKLKIQIQVNNKEEGCIYYWDIQKFSNRYYIVKDLLDRYFESNEIPILDKQEDPFWDPPEAHLIGQGFLKLLSLAYLMDNPSEITLVGDNGACGNMKVNLIPTDEQGIKNIGEEMDNEGDLIDDPSELLNKRIDFKVIIDFARLPDNFCRDTYCEYSILQGNKQYIIYKTPVIIGKNARPHYNYQQQHTYEKVTEEILNYLKESTLSFKVYGFEEVNAQGKQNISKHFKPIDEQEEFGNYFQNNLFN